MLAIAVYDRASPVDVVPGRCELPTVSTFGFTSADGGFVIIIPITACSNMAQDFSFLFTKLRKQCGRRLDLYHPRTHDRFADRPGEQCALWQIDRRWPF